MVTEPKNPRIPSAEDRDLAAIKRSRQTEVTSDQIETILDEDTKPIDIVQSRLDHDPAFAALWNRVSRIKKEDRRAVRSVANATLESHQHSGPSLEKRLDDIEIALDRMSTMMTIVKWLAGLVVAAALGSIIVVATKIFTWGEASGQTEIRLQFLEREVDSLRTQSIQNMIKKVVP